MAKGQKRSTNEARQPTKDAGKQSKRLAPKAG
jgi:hypothetical protein